MKKKRMVKVLRPEKAYSVNENGLWGHERDVYKKMFSDDGKIPVLHDKLNNIQKKILRKLKISEGCFLKPGAVIK